MAENSPEKESGCGLLKAIFRRNFWPAKTAAAGSIPAENCEEFVKQPSISKRRRNDSDEAAFLASSAKSDAPAPNKLAGKPNPTIPPATNQNPPRKIKIRDEETQTAPNYKVYVNQGRRVVPKESVSLSGELDSMIADQQKSTNVKLYGNLGNLKQPTAGNSNFYSDSKSNPKPVGDYAPNTKNPSGGEQTNSLCRALSTRMDPETLKIMGNEDYKNGRFAEALALYDAAISIDPNKASYRSNKCAALTALGKILEAVFECREAIRIEPHYHRAHNRLANLYLRLGQAENAMYHYKHAGPEADPEVITNAKILQNHLSKCTEALNHRDWNTLIKSAGFAIAAGADSAPQIYSLQAEALLKLHRYQEADEVLGKGPNFDVDDCTKFFSPVGNARLLVIQAQVHMAAGRLDEALAAAQHAARLDSNNREATIVLRKTRAVTTARSNGNALFKASNFSEACLAYGEGLDHDPYNSVLLCNRAACRSKLGQYEKAVEDCNAALKVRPSYTKARLRRADCYSKMGKWEASIQDHEILRREMPDDEEVAKGLSEGKLQLEK